MQIRRNPISYNITTGVCLRPYARLSATAIFSSSGQYPWYASSPQCTVHSLVVCDLRGRIVPALQAANRVSAANYR